MQGFPTKNKNQVELESGHLEEREVQKIKERGKLKNNTKARLRVIFEEEPDMPFVLFNQVLDNMLQIDRIIHQPKGHPTTDRIIPRIQKLTKQRKSTKKRAQKANRKTQEKLQPGPKLAANTERPKRRKQVNRRRKKMPMLTVQGLLKPDHCFVPPKTATKTAFKTELTKTAAKTASKTAAKISAQTDWAKTTAKAVGKTDYTKHLGEMLKPTRPKSSWPSSASSRPPKRPPRLSRPPSPSRPLSGPKKDAP